MDWLKQKISKKLIEVILTKLLVMALVAGNLAIGSPMDSTTVIAVASALVAAAIGYIYSQAQVDKVKEQLKVEIMKDVNNPNTPTTIQDVMDKI